MITYGIILLIAGVVAWAIGAALPNRVFHVVGQALGAIGLILLVVGIVLYVTRTGTLEVAAMGVLPWA